ncbi:MAG: glycosyltransferase family 87 protein [Flavobacteriales bacterium]
MKWTERISRVRPAWIFAAVALLSILISVQKLLLPKELFFGELHTAYNNYLIFKQSFTHLLTESPLYTYYPAEYGDLYKYSPTFALLMAPFSVLPDWAGLILWNLLNSLSLLYILYKLLEKNRYSFLFISAFILLELLTSLHNAQSNALVTALILCFVYENRKGNAWLAAFCLALSVYIKIFGGLAILLAFFSPRPWKTLLAFSVWMFILLIMPVLVVSPEYLLEQYTAWLHLLRTDLPHENNLSLYSVLGSLGIPPFPSIYLSFFGLILLIGILLAGLYRKRNEDNVIYLSVSLVLMWMVLFNHKSESPTYIIAVVGIGILYLLSERNWLSKVILVQSFICISLSSTDLFPIDFRMLYLYPAQVKVWGLIPAFLYGLYLLFAGRPLRNLPGKP